MLRLLAGLALTLALMPSAALAQFSSTDPINLTLSPSYPRPYDTVTVTVGSNALDLAASSVTIKANGAVVEQGMRSAQVRLGGPGSRTTITAVVDSPDGTFSKELVLAPADVSLIVEPLSTTQPLYKGAALVPSEGSVRIVALADLRSNPSTRIPNAQISYTWKLGTQILEAQSGLGRNVLTATAPVRYRDADISVIAATQSKSIVAQGAVTISPVDPVIRIYKSDPLEGIDFDHALSGTFALQGAEETFRALALFFKGTPAFKWSLNGNQSGTSPDITVRSSGGNGTALLSASATGPEARAESSLTLRFGGAGVGIFGR